MASKEEIKESIQNSGAINTLDKYSNVDDLFIMLDIVHEKQDYYGVESILRRFPKNGEYDKLIIDTLKKCNSKVSSFVKFEIIELIFADELKLQTLNAYISILDKEFVVGIINTLNDDELRKEKFRKYISDYDSIDFSDYLRHIKSDEIRLSEFLLYKVQFPDYQLDWFAGSFGTDQRRMEIFDEFYDESKKGQISHFVLYLKREENKVKLLDKYIGVIDSKDISEIIDLIKNNDLIFHIINKYKNKIKNYTLVRLLLKIDDENKRIQLLDELSHSLFPNQIMDVIISIKNINERIKIFDKYKDLFNYDELRTMLIYIKKPYGNEFLDKYIDYIDATLLADIWLRSDFFKGITLSDDEFFNKYIDRINTIEFSKMMERLVRQHYNYAGVINYLLSKTNNRKTIRNIFNAIAFNDKDYFLSKLINSTFFTSEEREMCSIIFDGDTHFYSYFIFELFEIPELMHNRYFLRKLSKYPELSQKIIDLYYKKPKVIVLLLLMIKEIYGYDIYHDNIINSLIQAVFNINNNFLYEIEAGKLTKERRIILIYYLLNTYDKDSSLIDVDINSIDDLDSYQEKRDKKIAEQYLLCDELDEKKNIVFNKVFGFSINKARIILYSYGFSLDKLDNNKLLDYIRVIKEIIKEKNPDTIDKYFYNLPILNFEERLFLEQELKKLFVKDIKKSLYKIDDKQPINNHIISLYEPTGDFYLMVNSLSAFRNHETINDYNDFWNKNSNIQNHGICCSLISNQNIAQTAPVDDIIFGFANFSDSAIQLANSFDISSVSNKLNLSSMGRNRFMTPEDYVNESREGHNEFVIERMELRNNINCINLQPDYVILYDYFDEDKINRSLKAASELNIPIVYLDANKIAFREEAIISSTIKKAIENLNVDLFIKGVVRYINNIFGLSEKYPNLVELYFDELKLNNYIESMLIKIKNVYQKNSIDNESALDLYRSILELLTREQEKSVSNKLVDFNLGIRKVNEYLNKANEKEDTKENKIL